MNVSKEDRLPAASVWQLEFIRLLAFPAEPPVFLDQHWWRDFAGQPEDYVSTRKKDIREDRGSFQGVVLSLRVDLGRVEWLIQPPVGFGESPGHFPTIGPFREKIDWVVDFLSPWLANSCPPLVRLALTGKLLQAAATQPEAYRVLGAYVPAVNLDTNPNDFFFQVNRRRTSTVIPDLPLNRISAWSKLNVAVSVESPAKTSFRWPDICYSALELDLNTAPERTELLPHELLPQLLRELAFLGIEIAEYGDIP
jgi:hypothetical protein